MKPVLTLLYVPADRPDRVRKALASRADVVAVDLEDAVVASRKDDSRANLVQLLADCERPVQVRINHISTPWFLPDLEAVRELPLAVDVRIPKVESPTEVTVVADALPGRRLHLLIESALGVERAYELGTASGRVASIGLGEADLRSDLRISDEAGLLWPRSRVVNAARAARLPSPLMSVYPHTRDVRGLVASCLAGKALGFLGRAAIHPAQLEPIRECFVPTAEEVEHARRVIDKVGDAATDGVGAIALADGTFLDVAMLEHARAVLAIMEPGATPHALRAWT